MTSYLLDVNVLISLIDFDHQHHSRSRGWFNRRELHAWHTSPTVESGALRISMNKHVLGDRFTAAMIIGAIGNLTALPGWTLIPEDISILDASIFDHDHITSRHQVTDTYLLALAARHDAILATLDQKLATTAVKLPNAKVHVI